MSRMRVTAAQILADCPMVVGFGGWGVLGSELPATGEHGPSVGYRWIDPIADANKEIWVRITTEPSAGTLLMWPDSSFEYDGPNSTATAQLALDGVDVGSAQPIALITAFTAAPAGVVTLGAPSFTSSSLSVTWTYSSADHVGFEYRYGPSSGGLSEWVRAGWAQLITVSGLDPYTEYRVEVRAYNPIGVSEADWTTVYVKPVATISHLAVSNLTSESARLTVNFAQGAAGKIHVAVLPSTSPAPTWSRASIGTNSGFSGSPVFSGTSVMSSAVTTYVVTPDANGLTALTSYRAYVVWDDDTTSSGVIASSSFTTNPIVVLVKGVRVRLYSGTTPRANVVGLRAMWWDATAPDGTAPKHYSASVATDSSGFLTLNINAATALSIGDYGYLHVHKAGTLGALYRDALIFGGALQVEDIS